MRRAAFLVLCVAACRDRSPSPGAATLPDDGKVAPLTPHKRELLALYDREVQRRAATDFATLPPSERVLGPDPYRIAALPDGSHVGILRGDDAVVLLRDGAESSRASAPRSPSGLAVAGDRIFVVGDGARAIAEYRAVDGKLAQIATLPVDALGLRDIAVDGGTAYVVEERAGRLLGIDLGTAKLRELGRCHGPIQIAAIAGAVVSNCMLDHALEIRRGERVVRIHHDGPLWSFALQRDRDGSLLIAAGGVEDHPLVREDGGFGYIDSYVYLYRLAPDAAQATRLAAVNASELGAITPKWIALRAEGREVAITTAGYGSAGLYALAWHGDSTAAPVVTRRELPPGTASATLAADGSLIAANPLLDGWVIARGDAVRTVTVATAQPARSQPSRIGELLFFTNLMAPWNSSEGKLSRFTCETCHHEGYGDGRIHYTGRDDVHAATRPLYGLFNNAPYFSRALDQSTTQMVHSEFKVANRHNGRDPWFALSRADVPWTAAFGLPEQMSPELLRESFIAFLADYTHRANPAADHAQLTPLERAGAVAFREHCASCHAARLIADDPRSAVPFERWEALVLSPSGPIVWNDASYAVTSVTPYVHASGTRTPSLRRLYKKWPYFTNGSAASLADVLDRYGTTGAATFHDHAPADAVRLSSDDKRALLAFLDLL